MLYLTCKNYQNSYWESPESSWRCIPTPPRPLSKEARGAGPGEQLLYNTINHLAALGRHIKAGFHCGVWSDLGEVLDELPAAQIPSPRSLNIHPRFVMGTSVQRDGGRGRGEVTKKQVQVLFEMNSFYICLIIISEAISSTLYFQISPVLLQVSPHLVLVWFRHCLLLVWFNSSPVLF